MQVLRSTAPVHLCIPLVLQTVSAASATTIAKPIKEQKVDKEKVWLIFILGAAGLFGGTLLLENNERFFPAIYKANLAMSQAKKAMKVRAASRVCYKAGGLMCA